MSYKLFLVVILALVLVSVSASAVTLTSNGEVHTVTQGNLEFRTDPSGLVKLFKNGEYLSAFGSSLKNTVNGEQEFWNSWATTWTWEVLSNTDSNITVLGSTNWAGWAWKQKWFFSDTEQKFTNYLTNNTGFQATNVSFYQVVRLDETNVECIQYVDNDGLENEYCFEQDITITQNLEQFLKRVSFKETIFNFQDLVDTGFEFNYLFAGQLGNVHPSLAGQGFIIGVTKNEGVFPNGASVILDPTITNDLTSIANLPIFGAGTPSIFRVDSQNLGVTASPKAEVIFGRYYETANNGLNWSTSDFNFYTTASEAANISTIYRPDNKKILTLFVNPEWDDDIHFIEGDFDNNSLTRTGWDANIALGFGLVIDAERYGADLNSGNWLNICGAEVGGSQRARCRFVDTDLNTSNINNWGAVEESFTFQSNVQDFSIYNDSNSNLFALYSLAGAQTNGNAKLRMKYDVNGSWSNDLNISSDLNTDLAWRFTGSAFVETTDENLVVLLSAQNGAATNDATILRFCDDGAEACISDLSNWDTYENVYDGNFLYWGSLATDTNNNIYMIGTDCQNGLCNTDSGLGYKIFFDLNKSVSAKRFIADNNSALDATKFSVTRNSDENGLIDIAFHVSDATLGTASLEYFQIFGDSNSSMINAFFTTTPASPIVLDLEEGITNVQVDLNSTTDFLPDGRIVDINYLWQIDGEEISTDQNLVRDFNGLSRDINLSLIVQGNDLVDTLTSQNDQNILLRSAPQGIDFNFANNTFVNNVDVNFTVTATGTINFAVWGGTDFDTNLLGTTVTKTFTQNKITQVCVIVNGSGDTNKLLCKDFVVARWLVSPAIDEETNASLTPTITTYNRPNQTYTHSVDINVFTFYGPEINYDTNAAFLIDFNTSYFTRNYFFDLDDNITLFLLQPRLPLVANSIQSTIFTIDNFTRDTVPDIIIQAIRTIGGVETIVESTISDSTGTATMSFVANLDYTLRFLDADGTILSEGPLGPKSTVLYAFIGTGEISFVLTPVGELVVTWIPNASSIDANTSFTVRFNQIINQIDLNISTITVRISQGDTNFFIQDFNFLGADTNIFQDVNVLDANEFGFIVVNITAQTPDGNFTKSFSYILVFRAGGSILNNLRDMKEELGPTVVLIIAVIITLFTVAAFASVATTDFNWLGIIALFSLGIFTYFTWIPFTVYLAALLMGGAGLIYGWIK